MLRKVFLHRKTVFQTHQWNKFSPFQLRVFSEKGPYDKDNSTKPKLTSIFGNQPKKTQSPKEAQTKATQTPRETPKPTEQPITQSQSSILLEQGEYIDFDQNFKVNPSDVYLSQKVANFQLHRTRTSTNNSYKTRIDEILDVEVTQETKLETDASISHIFQKYDSFDFGKKQETTKQTQAQQPKNFEKINQILQSALLGATKNLDKEIKTKKPSLIEASKQKLENSAHFKEVELTWARLIELKQRLGEDAPSLKNITKQDIYNSSSLRNTLMDFNAYHLILAQNPDKSFHREYSSEREKKISLEQSLIQSDIYKQAKNVLEVSVYNAEKGSEIASAEEGIEKFDLPDNVFDPMKVNIKKLEREIKNELKALHIEKPEVAEVHAKFLFSKDTHIDKEFAKPAIPIEEIKFYPGSIKGPMPEDDPETYSRWFYEHQPKSLKEDGVLNVDELGIKKKLIRGERESKYSNEVKTPAEYFFEADEEYPLVNTKRPPEFEIFNREAYNVQNEDDLPAVTFQSMMELHELAPQTTDNVINYWLYHVEQEPWAIFRALPELIKFDKAVIDYFKGIQNGTLPIPQFMKKTNPPSLWTYYLTLPEWCRNHPAIYNLVHAFEYHQPAVDIRQKELAMNLACSFLRPIEGRLRDVIIEVAASKKIRLNVELGKIMVNEQKFYEIDVAELGDSSDDIQEGENELLKLLTKGLDDEEKKNADIGQLIEKVVGGLGYEQRMKEREKILISEQNIDKYQFEAATEEVMADFPLKPYCQVDEIQAAEAVQHEPLIPCNFYDNDDGFWNDYIDHKQQRWQEAGMITHRKFFKH